jgi:ABC-2 family transporter protein
LTDRIEAHMVRPHIVRALLYKEYLRYRYNWGLLAVVAALLALSALVAVASRSGTSQVLGSTELKSCRLFYQPGTRGEEWARHLAAQQPPDGVTVVALGRHPAAPPPALEAGEMAIEIAGPPPGMVHEIYSARYWYVGPPGADAQAVRDWFVRSSNEFLNTKPRLVEETRDDARSCGGDPSERVPLVVTALAIFALYLLSFNLYITSTGEEREKRVLLGLLMTPAAAIEVIAAKAIFYAAASLVVCLAVVGMYQPRLLLNPYLWGAAVCGSVAYVSIGTVVVSIVRRQTTINTVSMLYLIATSVLMILSQFLPLFTALKMVLVENYLHGLMKRIVAGDGPTRAVMGYMIALTVATACWSAVAVWVFAKRGTTIARGR